MYDLTIEDYFSAAHNLKDYQGDCEHLHGHNWKVRVIVQIDGLDPIGLGIDFRELKKILKDTLSILDHKYLNDIEEFKKVNPTTEHIARFIFMRFKEKLEPFNNARMKKVTAWEGINSSASYYE